MGINEVKKEILNNAKKEAKRIIETAEVEKKTVVEASESRVIEIKIQLEGEMKRSIELYENLIMAEANSMVKKQRLNLEKEIINKVFNDAKEELSNLSKSERESHIKKLLKNSDGYSMVYCAEKDLSITKNAQKIDISGGIVLENKEGEIRLDLSYETLLESVKQKKLSEVANLLFE